VIRVAILTPGGVGPSGEKIHIPPLAKLVERLSSRYEIEIFSLNAGRRRRETEHWGNGTIHYIEATYDSTFSQKIFSLSSAVIREHRRRKFDLLHGLWALPCGVLAVLLGKLYRVPSLVSLLGGETAGLRRIRYGNYSRKSTAALTRWTCENADRIVAMTKFQEHQLFSLGIHRSDLVLIPIGADEMFTGNGRNHKPTPPFRFLHVGSLTEVKDQATLLKAFATISRTVDARLQIVGSDYMGGRMQSLARELGVEKLIEFVGQVGHAQLRDHFVWADVLLHTSLHEAQSVVVAEAAASGVAIAGTRVGLIADFGEDKSVVVDPGDYVNLATRVVGLLEDPARYENIQRNARAWALRHTLGWTVDAYADLYREMT